MNPYAWSCWIAAVKRITQQVFNTHTFHILSASGKYLAVYDSRFKRVGVPLGQFARHYIVVRVQHDFLPWFATCPFSYQNGLVFFRVVQFGVQLELLAEGK